MFRGRLSRRKRSIDAAAVAVCSVLLLSACGGSDSGSAETDPAEVGEPVAGGVATVIQMGEPRTLDPRP